MLLGIDSGQTLLKAVVYGADGTEIGGASRPCMTLTPRPEWAERDAGQVRQQLLQVIVAALDSAGVAGAAIEGIGIAGHGDGLYLVGDDGVPTRNAILSVDQRAARVLESMRADGSMAAAMTHTGQPIFAASMAPLLRWLATEEPGTLERTRWFLSCKDWLRFCLTGDIATDFADGNACFATLEGTAYSDAALAAYGLTGVAEKLPPMRAATQVVGGVRPEIARATGLRAGTPAVVGTHDVVATAIGLGAGEREDVSVIAGTFGMNQVLSAERRFGEMSQTRPWPEDDRWLVMSGSPTSASNFDWFVRTHMAEVPDPIEIANAEVAEALGDDSQLIFHPFLFGGPFGQDARLIGLQAWHGRRHVLRAIWEGVVFTHGLHLDGMLGGCAPTALRLGGGAARSATWAQLFADGLQCAVRTTEASEPGALGAALVAGVGIGRFASVADAQDRCVRVAATYRPDAARREDWRAARARFVESLQG